MELRPLSVIELEEQDAIVLPDRNALSNIWVGPILVLATNTSVAANVLSAGSVALSGAFQYVHIG